MLIDSITVAAFRGIRNEIELDLSAPITLLHAPNGTGKTSICDAIEWLMMGSVRRLEPALSKAGYQGIRNYSAGERETFIRCTFNEGDKSYDIRRRATADSSRVEQFRTAWRNFPENSLLATVTPRDLPASSTRQQNINRTTWFRAVRFLEAPNLELLLDDDQNAQQTRGVLFADLFGVGEIQEKQQKLQNVLGNMTPPSRIQSEIERLRTEIQQLTALLDQAAAQASAPFREAAREHVTQLASLLQWPVPDEMSLEEALLKLQERLRMRQGAVDRSRESINSVLAEWDRFQSTSVEVARIEAEQKADAERTTELRSTLRGCEQLVAQATAALNRSTHEEREVQALAIDPLLARLNSALEAFAASKGDLNRTLNLSEIQAKEAQLARQKIVSEQNQRLIVDCAEKLPSWQQAHAQLQSALSRSAAFTLPTEAQLVENERLITDAERELQRIESEFNRIAGPLQRLRAEGEQVVNALRNDPHCPLCGHDHSSVEHLRAAIEASLTALPEALAILARQRKTNEDAIQTARAKKRQWSEISAEKTRLERSISNDRESLRIAASQLQGLGDSGLDLSQNDFAQRFETIRQTVARSLQQITRDESSLATLRQRADLLQELKSEAEAISNRLSTALRPAPFSAIGLNDLVLKDWPQQVSQLRAQRGQILVTLANNTTTARTQLDETAGQLRNVQNQMAATLDPRTAREAQLGQLRPVLQRIKERWEQAALDRELTREAIDQVSEELVDASNSLSVASTRLASAAEMLELARRASERERQTAAEREKLEGLQKQLHHYQRVHLRRETLSSAITSLSAARDEFISSQVQPLCDVITALYCRAQSNPFITKIEANEQKGVHRWRAIADEISLESIAQMSQGQRQDLALAIFLARAREVRGTFFLDEPLLHLDDLNRVGLLDILRVLISERRDAPLRLIITTASNALVRHFREKFHSVPAGVGRNALRIYRLSGTPITEVKAEPV